MSKVKICGLRRIEDIDSVNRVVPDFIGFVFAESRRCVDSDTAARLKERLDKRIQAVGVFVNQPIDYIAGLYRDEVIDLVQLHGEEDAGYICRLRENCGCQVIKSVSIDSFLPDTPEAADYILFDKASKARGGTGKAFDWNILQGYNGAAYFLAGGLDPSSVERAVSLLNPFCVDVSSGVETDGVKDMAKIERFVRLVRRVQ